MFIESLAALARPQKERTWVYVPYDQLTDKVGPVSNIPATSLGIVLVESAHKAGRRRYHKQKLLWVLSSQRHFALEQARRGVAVDYRISRRPYAEVLADVIADRGPLLCMEPAERELREELNALPLQWVPHEGWLTTDADFDSIGSLPWRMDVFYRRVRRRTGLLMEDGKPVGGRFSFDGENREFWKGEPAAPEPPAFVPDPIVEEVCALIAEHFADHPGRMDPTTVAARQADADALWAWAKASCMTWFGPYEDAMSTHSSGLFHTRIAPLLNNGRLAAQQVVEDVAALDIPLNSKEGFIRQVLGWREFVRHVHRKTDGLRSAEGMTLPDDVLGRTTALHPTFWGESPSGLSCLDTVVDDVWNTGWTHHIPRLMVLANLATLMNLRPQEVSDWFWVGFIDAYDWVVEPNVLGMGTFAKGALMTTKPYVSGAAYIDKMSDYCGSCAFHPKKTCPITRLYWAFLSRHAAALQDNQRMRLPLASLRKRSPEKRDLDVRTAEWVEQTLAAGKVLHPDDRPR